MSKVYFGNIEVPVMYSVDCCVCGGGTSGIAAAVMSARQGIRTLIIEKGITLGGSQTQALVLPFMPTLVDGSDTPFITEIKNRMLCEGIDMSDSVTTFGWFNPEKLAYIYDELLKEADGEVLYNAVLIGSVVDNGKINYIIIHTIEGISAIEAKVFIDATGDATLSRLSGIPVQDGYEKTGLNQPMSFRFEMGGIDLEELYEYLKTLNYTWCATRPPYFEIAMARNREIKYVLEPIFIRGYENGELTLEDIEYFQGFTIIGKPGFMSMNCPEIPARFKATKAFDISKAIVLGRGMMNRISKFLIKNLPGFETSFISREPAMIGVRESFRIIGKYLMTEEDYYNRRTFKDAVVKTSWFIDAHGVKVGEYLQKGEYYEIPYRALVANEIENIIIAGRCISATFILQASMRIQPTCISIGETAGIAAYESIKRNVAIRDLDWCSVDYNLKPYKK